MSIHAARIKHSDRLKRVLAVLQCGTPQSTMHIQHTAQVCAVGTCVSELRRNGFDIICNQRSRDDGRRVWYYTLVSEANKS